ncbi:cyclin-Q-like [Styela clava]|uniref:cyclin-Q-like n=1 Tax=Styela clava TaxID=7725 RepID=UPI0019393146|nr:cyclin-Q-like [Styela clava]
MDNSDEKSTNSRKKDKDSLLHFKVSRFIIESSAKLKLNSVTLASACVLYHRFYQECEIEDYDPYTIAATAIFLATKIEEQHTRLRDVVNVCHRTLFPSKPLLEIGRELYDLKDTIANCELLILRVLEFKVTCDHPHKYILHYLMSLSQFFNRREWERHTVAQTAWAILQDCYHGTICLSHRPQLVAISCIYLALLTCKVEVPLKHSCKTPWWKVFHSTVSKHEISTVMDEIVDLYNLEKQC